MVALKPLLKGGKGLVGQPFEGTAEGGNRTIAAAVARGTERNKGTEGMTLRPRI
jgi:hypothetical protein